VQFSRRHFLAGQGIALGASLLPQAIVAATQATTDQMPPLDNWTLVRDQFHLSPDYIHLSYFFLASHPEPVRLAIEKLRRAIDDNPYLVVEHALFGTEAESLHRRVCGEAASYLGARPEEVAMVGNTTTGLTMVYHGLPLKAGDEVVVTTHDHFVHNEAARLATQRSGASLRRISLYEDSAAASADEIVARVRAEIRPQTRVLGITWVDSMNGVRSPVRAIADALADLNRNRAEEDRVRLIVDGVHGLGAVDERVAELGCDFFCAGTHKWIFGPRGTGIVWARASEWARIRPLFPPVNDLEPYLAWLKGEAPKSPTNAWRVMYGGFHAFEHLWATSAAFQMHQRIGRARVAARISELNSRLKDGLRKIPGVKLHTPRAPELSAGLCCFQLHGRSSEDTVAALLKHKVLASVAPYPNGLARLSAGLMNTPEEIDRALAAVQAVASSATS
jgi:isopenicillin-N epimerase